jgi:NAD(P)H dehydrogenase (quinone)
MKHAIIIGHPNPGSFTVSMAKAYEGAVQALGHTALVRDLYRLGFDPCLAADEIPSPKGFAPHDDVKAERTLLRDVDVFAFFYPVWFNAPPAIIKGYADRIFGMGFGYGMGDGGNEPLLVGRRMVSFSSSGAPKSWMIETGAWDAMRKLFDEHFAAVCGLTVLDHIHFGGIVPNITEDAVASCAGQTAAAATRLFGRAD